MRILKEKSGWVVYSEGTASEGPKGLIVINPIGANRIDFQDLTGCNMFCSMSIDTLTPEPGLVGCSDLLLIDWNDGLERLWVIGARDSELKYFGVLDTGYDTCEDTYLVERKTVGVHEVWALIVNDKIVWPEIKEA